MIVHGNSPKMLRKSIDKKNWELVKAVITYHSFQLLEIPLGRNVLVLVTFGIDSQKDLLQ